MRVCGFTGYRYEKLPFSRFDEAAEARLLTRIKECCVCAIDAGCTHFISGFAQGSDLLFAQAVAELKNDYAVTLEAALPFPRPCASWLRADRERYFAMMRRCDCASEISPRPGKRYYLLRNDYIVRESDRLIAVYDGKPGGTAYTVAQAEKKGVIIDRIKP